MLDPTADPMKDPAPRRSIVAIMVGAMAVVFDTTILSIAIPTLSKDFGALLNTVQWVVTAYPLGVVPQTQARHVTSRHVTSPEQAAHAFSNTFWWAVGFMALGLVLAPLLPGRSMTKGVPPLELVDAEVWRDAGRRGGGTGAIATRRPSSAARRPTRSRRSWPPRSRRNTRSEA